MTPDSRKKELEEKIAGLKYDQTVPENSPSQNWEYAQQQERLEDEQDALSAEKTVDTATKDIRTKIQHNVIPAETADGTGKTYREETEFNSDGSRNPNWPRE